ncbi:hypothetical protein ACHQM5_001053 [Ranunculus cassubicifolius]
MEGGRKKEEIVVRKGPWMAEEDEILMNYVNKYGPRDWSSIRSKGLLPRTGKSCRLRWVNKLKPDLKTGCKFSADEERVVIELQERFGNRWARIATYLPGRTDNDVKNFWSTRQKRLARVLQTSNLPKTPKNNGKSPVFHPGTTMEGPRLNSMMMEQGTSSSRNHIQPYMENPEALQMMPLLPDLMYPGLLSLEPNLSQLEFTPIEKKPCMELPQPQFSFAQLPHPPTLDLPILPETNDQLAPALVDTGNLMDMFQDTQAPVNLPFLGLRGNGRNGGRGDGENPATPDSFFDDFPTDMFDYIESLPSSSEW